MVKADVAQLVERNLAKVNVESSSLFIRSKEIDMFEKLKKKVSANRMTYISVALVVTIGDTLTGWSNVHWILWIPPVALTLAAVTGVCPFKIGFVKLGFSSENENDKFCK